MGSKQKTSHENGAGEASRGALQGIRVLDLATPLAEATGRVFTDLGAEVLKIEPPGGCESRFTPPYASGGEGDPEGSLLWRAWGLGKRSLVLDLEREADRERFIALARGADVLIESFTPGAMDALDLGPEALRAVNPALIYVSVSPFGQTGPFAKHPATDLTLAAAGGLLNMQGDGDRPPIPVGFPETVHHGAVQAAADAILALYARNRCGTGQHLDTSVQAAVLWSLMNVTDYAAYGQDPPGCGDERAGRSGGQEIAPGLTLPVMEPCRDGHVVMTLVLGAQGAHGFNAAMRWVGERGGLDPDLMEIDWMTWIQQIQEGKLEIANAKRGVEQFLAHMHTLTKAENPSPGGRPEVADRARQHRGRPVRRLPAPRPWVLDGGRRRDAAGALRAPDDNADPLHRPRPASRPGPEPGRRGRTPARAPERRGARAPLEPVRGPEGRGLFVDRRRPR